MHALLAVARGIEEPRSGFGQRSKASGSFAECVSRSRALGDELLRAQREMKLDLIFDFMLPTVTPAKHEAKRSTNAGANHVAAAGSPLLDAVRMLVTVSAYWTQLRVSARSWVRPAVVRL